ncbi:MAG: aminopeptidase P family protein [Micavibrio sp.]
MEQAEKLSGLRAELKKQGVDGFLIPRADEYQGEYVPARAERLAWLTGFTGSAGIAAVLATKALVTTDSRYELQIKKQVDGASFETLVTDQAGYAKWIADNAVSGQVIGYDPKLHTPAQIAALEKVLKVKNVTLKPLTDNPLDAVWDDQPGAPMDKVEIFPDHIAGRSARDKREAIAAAIAKDGADAGVITLPDSIAWLLNIRGTDVPHTPLALSNAIVHANGDVDWFIAAAKIPADVKAHLGNHVQVKDPSTLESSLRALAGKSVQFDPKRSSIWFRQVLEQAGAKVVERDDPCVLPKACKTPEEQKAIRNAHLRDGVAVTKFLVWLDKEAPKGNLSELDVVAKLEAFRKLDPGYRDGSFDTISGWAANGAIVHYRATPESHAAIKPPGILLLDSGGQYQEGTTDITRTVTIGAPSAEAKEAFTRVLKGHIGIASLRFPEGVTGQQVDVLARKSLWDVGMDYGHGTGHGVGCYLSVHEEGGRISFAGNTPFKPGMVVSNEPGYYKEGAFGIRIENLVLVKDDGRALQGGKAMLAFETVTLVPFDRRLIQLDLMNAQEIAWVDEYHQRVAKALSPHLDAAELKWLAEATAPLKKPDAAGPVPRRPNAPGPT